MSRGLTTGQIWLRPLLFNLISLVGLISALLSDSWGDWLAWLTLGLPVLAIAYYWWGKTDKGHVRRSA
ncbi:hypothetical protein [Neptunicella sp. SCSIO 80796]|uniref:hypothetical protein n=1 Tax=Neptunicella plasticusilytica TaxID=3117012 RepID=UPI003A4E5719